MKDRLTSITWRQVLPILIAVFALFGVNLVVDTGTPDEPEKPSSITITVNTNTGPTTITTTPAAVEAAAPVDAGGRDETPPGLSPEAVAAAAAQQDLFAKKDRLPLTQPDAAPEQPGCRSNFVKSYSSRGGTKPRLIVEHYTVSGNLPGFRDINALTAYSNNTANGVSWTYNFDRDGNCAYTVRETDKPWTQATMNRVSIGIEIINRGAGDGPLFTSSGLKRHARVVSDISRRWDIPVRRGKINRSTCTVVRSGILDHNSLGTCGGNHFDITPYDVDKIITAVRVYRAKTDATTRRCNELAALRKRAAWRKRTGRTPTWTKSRATRARALKRVLGPKAASCR